MGATFRIWDSILSDRTKRPKGQANRDNDGRLNSIERREYCGRNRTLLGLQDGQGTS